jgi:small conductance mechanosensitive channel
MTYDSLSNWWRDGLLPTVLIVLGAILIVRFVRWVGDRYQDELDGQARDLIAAGDVIPESLKRSRALAQAIVWSVVALTFFLAVVLGIRQLGVPIATLIAPATVIGVALGFGAQSMVADLLAGFFLFSERQFGVGDLIRLSTPGTVDGITGTVEELTLRVTRLRSAQGELVVVPNGALRQVTNLSRDWSRVILDIPVPVTEDLGKVTTLLHDAAASMQHDPSWSPMLLGDPVVAGVETIEVSYVRLRLVVRTQPGRQFDVSRELRRRCVDALRNAGIFTTPVEASPTA